MPTPVAAIEFPEAVQVIILAVLQGIAEFLPISSSGHVVVMSKLLDGKFDVTELNIVLHAGTLLSIFVFYRRQILWLLTKNRRVVPMLVIGTLPVVVTGLVIKMKYSWITKDPLLAGFMFVVTGFLLMTLDKLGNDDEDDEKKSAGAEPTPETGIEYTEISWKQSLIIGLFQAVAILPGISRSGSTIVGGCLLGLKRQSAATFSFLLAIPAILGATSLEVYSMIKEEPSTPLWLLALGFFISFVVGLGSIALLVRWLGKGRLHLFAYYVIPLGFTVVVWQLFGDMDAIKTLIK